MEVLLEQILIYGLTGGVCLAVVWFYLRSQSKKSEIVVEKIKQAKEDGMYEPVSLHPVIDLNTCIGSAACVAACPEKDILGIVNGQASIINSSQCVGHGACFHSCPVEAITLQIGTEKRGVDLPHVNQNFETNIKGIYIAGELGGMGLIKNSVEQGKQAVESILKSGITKDPSSYDIIIIGAGPAGISATLMAKKNNLNTLTLEQDSLGGTVFTFPRSKIVMTNPMDLPLHGKVKLYDTNKSELLNLWNEVISKNNIKINENTKVEAIVPQKDGLFKILTNNGEEFITKNVLIAIGRRGSPRKLGVPGEESEKVAYRLIEPERISDKKVVIVGGGDSAVEAAISLMKNNKVTISYRNDTFNRIKSKNRDRLEEAINLKLIDVKFNTNVLEINDKDVLIKDNSKDEIYRLENDLVYIFAGGELPTKFLQNAGVEISKRFGYVVKKHGE